MKTLLLVATLLSSLSALAQTTAISPPTTTVTPSPVAVTPSPVFVPGGGALGIDAVNPGVAATTTTPTTTPPRGSAITGATPTTGTTTGTTPTTTVNTNLSVRRLSLLLTNLEHAVVATLPTLSSFNDGFNFFVLDTTGATTGVGSAGNFVTDLTTTNLFSNPGSLQGGSFAGPTGGTANATTGPTNTFGQPIGGTAVAVTRETLRALLVLQNDLERLAPLLDTLNRGTNFTTISLTPGFVPGSFSNVFGPLR